MPICIVTIVSSNKQSLSNFLFFLFKNSKINFVCKFVEKKNKKKVITVLKSPHVNKKAQEQFEIRSFSKQCKLFCYNSPKFLITLKKIKTTLFPDVKIKIKFFIAAKNSLRSKVKVFNVNNYRLAKRTFNPFSQEFTRNKIYDIQNKNYFRSKKKLIKKTKNYLKIFDCYGELNLGV